MKKFKFRLSTTQIILLSFLITILLGSAFLSLPIASKSGKSIAYIDALFTATTATCVTGLVTAPVITTFSVFGQVVILILIQLGGLGIITVTAGIMIALHRKIGIKDSALISDAFNLNSRSGLSQFVKKVILGTFIIELVGALIYMTVFIPSFGAKGIWISIFNSVSAFCNAGLDIVSTASLTGFAFNPVINGVTSLLIVIGGLGYIVWWDVIRVIKNFKRQKFKCFNSLTLHSKIALTFSAILIVVGAVCVFALEYNNPLTLKGTSLFNKIQVSIFQSITTRTAGFATIPQENLTNATAVICIILMFIGGSPVGTAGGIKTVTVAVLIASAISAIRNKNEVTLFNRNITEQVVRKAVAVALTSLAIVIVSTVLTMVATSATALDVIYETVSATATVGLSRNVTATLNIFGKIVITFTMYFGRVGPISLMVAFSSKKMIENNIKNPIEDVSVG